MTRIVTGGGLVEAVKSEGFVKGGDVGCVEGVKYDFRLSSRILKASFEHPIDVTKLSEAERKELFIEPDEMVFALTEERLDLPANMMAELSPRRKLSHAGILAIGGSCIDPLYRGHLLVGLFNLSSARFPLIPGERVIAATFYVLENTESGDCPQPEAALADFPDELIQVMQKYRPLATALLFESIQRLQVQIDAIVKRSDLTVNKRVRRSRPVLSIRDDNRGEICRIPAGVVPAETLRDVIPRSKNKGMRS